MKTIAAILLTIAMGVATVWGGSIGESVEVRIVTDDGRTLHTYPVKNRHNVKKVYAEAVKGDQYRIEVTNRLNRRVGLVIAVDGRNIISGGKSWLKNGERMYILEPYESGQFSGWRSTNDRVNRFYFTDVPDSYAAAFGDESAMGVISVAAYPEEQPYIPPRPMTQTQSEHDRLGKGTTGFADRSESAAPPAAAPAPASEPPRNRAAKSEMKSMKQAGTGYGHEEYSPVRIVSFKPQKQAAETIHIKYEWRSTLCRRGVINCDIPQQRYSNRLWDNGGYAPPPPRRY